MDGFLIRGTTSCLTWLFFFSRITVPSSISNSPWSFRHLTWKDRCQHDVTVGGGALVGGLTWMYRLFGGFMSCVMSSPSPPPMERMKAARDFLY